MRLLPGFTIACVLVLLLIGTTPTGTGAGVHQFDLVHPLFSHVHIVNGQVLSHDQMIQQAGSVSSTSTSAGPGLGAGAGASQTLDGLGISPLLPAHAVHLMTPLLSSRMAVSVRLPTGRMRDTPPDPPPTSAA
jgi:hypothetical protein